METVELFGGVFLLNGRLATENLVKGDRVYGEELVAHNNREYRLWTPYRSKLSGAILNGLKSFHIKKESSVLYLGASTGTTASHVSDIVGQEGRVYCVEFAERSMRNLVEVCARRPNMLPILADARMHTTYSETVEKCDVLYQDVAAKEQAEILIANSNLLKKGGYAYFVIKSQSIDVSKRPKEVFDESLAKLKNWFEVVEKVSLEPYDSHHLFVVLRKI